MSCPRCAGIRAATSAWCRECELLYDRWVRTHASDVVWQALSGAIVIIVIGLGLPVLGVGPLVAAAGAFAGFGMMAGLARLNRRRRRQQFLTASLPKAYLPTSK